MTSVTIDRGDLTDVARAVEFWRALAEEQLEHGSRVCPAATETAVREEIARHAAADRLLVARDPEIVGFVTFDVERGRYQLDTTRGVVEAIYVVPDRRGEGIGTALLERAENALRGRGAETVTLETMAANEAARRFYRERGYDPHRIVYEKAAESDNHSKEGR